jgi:hypothetical protein
MFQTNSRGWKPSNWVMRRLGHRFQRFAGGVGDQMDMRPGGFRHQQGTGKQE